MSLVYIAKLNKFIYDEDFKIVDGSLSYKFINASEDEKETDTGVWIHYKTPMHKIVELIKNLGKTTDLIILDKSLYLNSNIPVKNVLMYKFPNGETCKKVLKNVLKKKYSDDIYLVSQDDGTRSTLPSIYYALSALKRLDLVRVFPSVNYVKNYKSCSSSKFSRAKVKVNILDYRISPVDYIITTGFHNEEDTLELFNWVVPMATKGLLIFTKVNKLLPMPQKLIHFHNLMYFYYYDFIDDTYELLNTIKSKPSNLELLPFLRGQRG
jgi:hypothetical protein